MTAAVAIGVALLAFAPTEARAEGMSAKEVAATAHRLAERLGMPQDKRALVERRLAALMEDARFRSKYGTTPIRGVLAYQMGEGGLVVKVKKGHGLARLEGEAGDEKLVFKSVTVGAQIGGSSEWGLGLVLGLTSPRIFGGDYSGGTVGATMAASGTGMMELTSKQAMDGHKVYLIGTATGASANAGGGKLTIEVER
ncbi:MAG TPA: hypothetical protein VN947_32895 [Polyangia bacterium]|nr:hypothetical protein [Polyangia bacterium]